MEYGHSSSMYNWVSDMQLVTPGVDHTNFISQLSITLFVCHSFLTVLFTHNSSYCCCAS